VAATALECAASCRDGQTSRRGSRRPKRIAAYQLRIAHGDCRDAALAATMLYSAAYALRELRSHKTRLDKFDAGASPW
jgi:hypothetical protein